MPSAGPLTAHQCLGVGRQTLLTLRAALESENAPQAASHLTNAGFAGGAQVYQAFAAWLAAGYGVERPGELDHRHLGEVLSAFFTELGWGTLAPIQLAAPVLALDSTDWSEAMPEAAAPYPSCHLSSGMLAEFLGRLSGGVVGVMEVECRTRGDARCRFLAGAPETLTTIYEGMTQGLAYQQVLGVIG